MNTPRSDVAFTPSVKAIQARKGSRNAYCRMEEKGGWQKEITDDLTAFIAEQSSFFMATVSSEGAPYIQHRGGPRGFLRVIGRTTLAFVDFKGNRQFISQGNLADNPKAHLFLIDYTRRQRIKIWGEARVVEDDPELLEDSCRAITRRVPSRLLSSKSWHGTPTVLSTYPYGSMPKTSNALWQNAMPGSQTLKPSSKKSGPVEVERPHLL